MPSVLFDIELEHPVDAVADIYRSRDSCLVDAVLRQLNAIATQLGCKPIGDFTLDGGWRAADEGLPTLQSLQAFLEAAPKAIFNSGYALTALRLWQRMLEAARDAGVRWQLSMELG